MKAVYTYQFGGCFGYDCVTPGVVVYCDGTHEFVIDARDHGWFDSGLGSGLEQHRADVIAKIITKAKKIVDTLNGSQ